MKGGRSISERRYLLKKLAGIVICVSDYIRNCFLDGLDDCGDLASKVGVARNGAHRWLKATTNQRKLYPIGRAHGARKRYFGMRHSHRASVATPPQVGVDHCRRKRFEESAPGSYEDKIATAIAPLKGRAKMLGFIPIAEMRDWQARAAISACPSLWQDPDAKSCS